MMKRLNNSSSVESSVQRGRGGRRGRGRSQYFTTIPTEENPFTYHLSSSSSSSSSSGTLRGGRGRRERRGRRRGRGRAKERKLNGGNSGMFCPTKEKTEELTLPWDETTKYEEAQNTDMGNETMPLNHMIGGCDKKRKREAEDQTNNNSKSNQRKSS